MIKLIKPYIKYEEIEKEFREIFESGWFTKGKNVDLFNNEISKYTESKYSQLTTSATTALSVCLKILEIGNGDEVIISDFSFPATVNVVEDCGAKPVFADVDLKTFNMRPEELENKISEKTKAVIFVDALGNPSGMHEIKAICKKYDIPLIEDAACAIGSSENGIKCGNIADLTCFSFHPRKLLTTGEGGAITTNNIDFFNNLKIKLNHGSIFNDGKFDFVDYGYNYRMSELQCVMGIAQIRKLDKIVEKRNKFRKEFSSDMEKLGFVPQKINDNVIYNVQSLVFKIPDKLNRDVLIKKLKDSDIETTLGTYCLSGTTYYRKKYGDVQQNSEYLEKNTITFPCHDDIEIDNMMEKIIKCF